MRINTLYKFFLSLVFCLSILSYIRAQEVSLPNNLLELRHSPSPYECAVLSTHVHQEATQAGRAILVEDNKIKHNLQDWKVLKTFHPDKLSKVWQQLGLSYHCQAILYCNETKKQLVLAYKGLELSNMANAIPDADTKHVMAIQKKVIIDLLTEALGIAQEQQYSLTVTGHSLGGWLAQLTAFMAQQLYPEQHVKTIAFDSPGARPMLEHLNAGPDAIQLDYLDITNYLSTPNLINASSPQMGTVYQVAFKRFSRKPTEYDLQSHAVENFFRAFSPNTGAAYHCAFVQQWPLLPLCIEEEKQTFTTKKMPRAVLGLLALFQKCVNKKYLHNSSNFFKLAHSAARHSNRPLSLIQKDRNGTAERHYIYKTKP
ncbi:MAG: Mbeg1-like protein, partial [Bacteroidota bacterium]